MDWTLGLKCDQRVWPWPWPWPWIFKVKYRICYIPAKNGLIATKRKANISIELQASNVTNGMDLPDSDWGDFSCRRAIDSSSLVIRNRKHSKFASHWHTVRWSLLVAGFCTKRISFTEKVFMGFTHHDASWSGDQSWSPWEAVFCFVVKELCYHCCWSCGWLSCQLRLFHSPIAQP